MSRVGGAVSHLGQPAERMEPMAGFLADARTRSRADVHGLGHPVRLLCRPHANAVYRARPLDCSHFAPANPILCPLQR